MNNGDEGNSRIRQRWQLHVSALGRIHTDGVVTAWIWTCLLALLVQTGADPDLWGHLRFGLDLLTTGRLPSIDVYSFTQDRPWINHEWLSEVQLALSYRIGGITGLLVLKLLILVSGLWTLTGILRPLPVLLRSASLALAGWAAVQMTLTARPQLWTWLFTILVSRLLLSPPSKRHLLSLPLIFAVWINCHGGVIVGAALLAIWTAYYVFATRDTRALAGAVAITSAAATLLNPYGPRLWVFLAETVRVGRDIQEWRSIWTAPWPMSALPWGISIAAVVGVTFSRARPRVDRLATMLLFAYASERTLRLVPLFTVISVVFLTPSLSALAGQYRWLSWRFTAPSRLAATVAVLPFVLFAAVIGSLAWQRANTCVPIMGSWTPDLAVGAAMKASSPRGRLVTTFAWSQYAIWHFGPSLRVSFDGRRETLYSEALEELNADVMRGEPDGLAFLAATRPEYVWLGSSSSRTRDWLRQRSDYRIDVETPSSFLAVRADQPVVRAADAVPAACFPG